MLADSMVVTTIPVTDLERALPFYRDTGIAQLGPSRGAWLKDPEGNVIGLREGLIPGRQEA